MEEACEGLVRGLWKGGHTVNPPATALKAGGRERPVLTPCFPLRFEKPKALP